MIISPSAPSSSASFEYSTAVGVWAFMVPARTGTRPALCSTTAEMIWVRSSRVTLRNSPVEPSAISPGTPLSICQSTKRRSAFSSTAEPSSVNGVNMTV